MKKRIKYTSCYLFFLMFVVFSTLRQFQDYDRKLIVGDLVIAPDPIAVTDVHDLLLTLDQPEVLKRVPVEVCELFLVKEPVLVLIEEVEELADLVFGDGNPADVGLHEVEGDLGVADDARGAAGGADGAVREHVFVGFLLWFLLELFLKKKITHTPNDGNLLLFQFCR